MIDYERTGSINSGRMVSGFCSKGAGGIGSII